MRERRALKDDFTKDVILEAIDLKRRFLNQSNPRLT